MRGRFAGRVVHPKCLTLNGVAYPLRFCSLQRVGHSSLRSTAVEQQDAMAGGPHVGFYVWGF